MLAPSQNPAVARKRGSFLASLLRFAVAAWLLRCLIIEPFYIPSGSMLPTMAIGDYLFVAKWPYGYSRFSFLGQFPPIAGRWGERLPARGDVLVFKSPSEGDATLVKRVIGLPGDSVEVRAGVTILNGRPLPKVAIGRFAMPVTPNSPCRTAGGLLPRTAVRNGRQVCFYPAFRERLPDGRTYLVLDQYDAPTADHFGPVTVPTGTLFMMGDNRDDSQDSRFATSQMGVGFLPMDRVIGRASLIFWSTDGQASLVKPWTWLSGIRTERIGTTY